MKMTDYNHLKRKETSSQVTMKKASSSKVKNILINRNVQISRGKQTACP